MDLEAQVLLLTGCVALGETILPSWVGLIFLISTVNVINEEEISGVL